MNEIELSIVIPTFNRKAILRGLLERLARQSAGSACFEVLLCDDGSSDGLPEMVAAMLPTLPYLVRLLPDTHRGPGAAQNRGIRAARAELVLLLAADILPSPVLVAEHLVSHRGHPAAQVVVCGGQTYSHGLPNNALQRATNKLNELVFNDDFCSARHGGFLVSNLSFKRGYMLEHGMFEEWPPASGEDLELGFRLRRRGMDLIRNPRALGYHHHPETLPSLMQRSYLNGYNIHHLAATVDELWARRRFGGETGAGAWRDRARDALRRVVLNRLSARWLLEPLIGLAERRRLLEPALPLLCQSLGSYYFARGMADYRAGRPFDLAHGGATALLRRTVDDGNESA